MTSKNALSVAGRRVRFGLAAGAVLFLVFLALPGPGLRTPLPFAPCAFHAISGLPCLFCGGTRAVRAILHGDFQAAAYLNALAFPALFFLVSAISALSIEAVTGHSLAPWEQLFRRISRFAPAVLLFAAVWWIIHICLALGTPKPELVNLKNPIAAGAKALFDRCGH